MWNEYEREYEWAGAMKKKMIEEFLWYVPVDDLYYD